MRSLPAVGTDFDRVQEIGISFLRYGPCLHRTWLGDGKYDWSFADQTFHDLRSARSSSSPIFATSVYRIGSGTFRIPIFLRCSPGMR